MFVSLEDCWAPFGSAGPLSPTNGTQFGGSSAAQLPVRRSLFGHVDSAEVTKLIDARKR
jgi:hypothetical protein